MNYPKLLKGGHKQLKSKSKDTPFVLSLRDENLFKRHKFIKDTKYSLTASNKVYTEWLIKERRPQLLPGSAQCAAARRLGLRLGLSGSSTCDPSTTFV